MSLSSALLTAKSSLAATSKQTSVVSSNIARANDPDYSRRTASLVSGPYGSLYVGISRSADEALFNRFIQSNSTASSTSILAGGLDRLSSLYSADNYSGSPSALIGDLRDALQTYAASPSNSALGDSVVSTAQSLANALNAGTKQIQSLRNDADREIADSVASINDLLAKFEKVNQEIVGGTRANRDVSDYMDQRDAILKQLSGEIGITTMMRGDNDMVIFAENGVTLFETTARKVSFEQSTVLAPGISGKAVLVDGVPLNHETFDQPYGTGRLSGLLQLRDQIAPQYQMQLDEIARNLVTMFAEGDDGLFIWAGAPGGPENAGTIKVSSSYVTSEGGSPTKLRDGVNGQFNPEGSAGFSERLRALNEAFSEPMVFDPATGLSASSSLIDYSASSISWLEGKRQKANSEFSYNATVATQADAALSNANGVDMDTEMALLLDLEHSYQASSRVLTTISAMLDDLLNAV
ncbi:flagellar hook-associated protein FlgK [Brucella intermedia]|uniref:Flagellar hook-associated protein 1 n=1 Tax=Brucella intermedia TaxID=94625 RepID=A0A7V6U1V1_9HYPH|nr:flagellar hook-associated protein FlgK [Brucella intermedia]WGG61596.1 flagellar hook-associated protein FlgK [Brucella intermedia]HHV70460.1 flagellar hook-associated protein FlgK [Brucella intermedia]